jgi:hypothetical protein
MRHPNLVKMTVDAFNALPSKVIPRTMRIKDPTFESDEATEWIVHEYCHRFIFENKALHEILFDKQRRIEAPKGLRILYSLCIFDGQVKNGGLEQFFWNYPGLIFDVSDALAELGVNDLQEAYDRAVECLCGKKERWHALREQAHLDSNNPDWEPFRQSYDLLDVGSFNDEYYDQHDSSDHTKVIERGFSSIMLRRLRDYVVDHKEEFVELGGTNNE